MQALEYAYGTLIAGGATPEEARSVLPTSLKTEIAVTMNLREWRHFFKLRGAVRSHPQMREVVLPLLEEFKKLLPAIFGDIDVS
jgi:thymidylate synthase (FAD)